MARWPQESIEVINANIVLPIIKLELASLTGQDPLLIEAGQTLKEFAIGSLQLAELKIALDQQLQTDLPIGPFLDDLTLQRTVVAPWAPPAVSQRAYQGRANRRVPQECPFQHASSSVSPDSPDH
jgi:hypothetical protein